MRGIVESNELSRNPNGVIEYNVRINNSVFPLNPEAHSVAAGDEIDVFFEAGVAHALIATSESTIGPTLPSRELRDRHGRLVSAG